MVSKINECDKCVYKNGTPNEFVIVCMYVDDILTMGSTHGIIMNTKKILKKHFNMKDMCLADVIILELLMELSYHNLILLRIYLRNSICLIIVRLATETPMDLSLHLAKNQGDPVYQLECARII